MSTPPGLPTEKKGMSCFAIGGIGCLVILIALFLGGGALVATYFPKLKETFEANFPKWKEALESYSKEAKANPDKATAKLGLKMIPTVQIVREDDAAHTITFKTGADGEEMTMHYEGISSGKGKPKITNSKGEEVDLSKKSKEAAPVPAPPAPPAPVPAPQQN